MAAAQEQPDGIAALLDHPKMKDIRFDSDFRAFRDTANRIVPGLTKKLKLAFWPNYEYTDAHKRYAKRRNTGNRHPSDGMKRGKNVHKQLELLTNEGASALRVRKKVPHTYTRKAVMAMKLWKWRPRRAEVSVFDGDLQIATKADMLATGRHGQTILIEFKTGYDNYWERGSSGMHGPLHGHLSNSPKHQALMQTLFTREIMQRSYGVTIDESWVVHIHSDGVTPYKLDGILANAAVADRLWNYFMVQMARMRHTRKESARSRRSKKKVKC